MKKVEQIVGIIPATGKEKKVPAKKEKRIRPYWNKLVSVFFNFCEDKFGERPSFMGGDPRYLAEIIDAMEIKSLNKKLEWTEDVAVRSLNLFLTYAFANKWLNEHFIPLNLARQKDIIFFNIKTDWINGKSTPTQKPEHGGNHKTAGQNIFADRLRDRIEKLK